MRELLQQLLHARKTSGKGIIRQLIEIYRLRRGEGQLGVSEYFGFQLYDDNLHPPETKSDFIGWRRENGLNQFFNREEWAALSLDKILFYGLLQATDLPHPRVHAVYSGTGRFVQGAQSLNGADQLAAYLRGAPPFPLFSKPSHGNYGRGGHLLTAFDAAADAVVFADGSTRGMDDYIAGLEIFLSGGYVYQEAFQPHPALAEICGPRASTVRAVVAVTSRGIRPISVVWKITTGNNVIDNFLHGQSGNLVASVDFSDGRVRRVIQADGKGGVEETNTHPDTGRDIMPLTLPDWDRVQALCENTAPLLTGMHLLHMDIGLSDRGPLLIEVNKGGDMDLHQVASGKGFLSAEMRAAMRDQEDYNNRVRAIVAENRRKASSVGA
jgi:hypothetical protein